jgi:4a-hydroxytetrahydrobiopterin dehydratase
MDRDDTGGATMLPLGRDDVRDALSQLTEWVGDTCEIRRTMRLDETEHAALTERIQVVADALQMRPDIRRFDGYTHVRLRTPDGGALTSGEVRLAARIEDAYRSVTAASPRDRQDQYDSSRLAQWTTRRPGKS